MLETNPSISLALVGVGLRVLNEANVIIRNIKISKVLASAGDAIGTFLNIIKFRNIRT